VAPFEDCGPLNEGTLNGTMEISFALISIAFWFVRLPSGTASRFADGSPCVGVFLHLCGAPIISLANHETRDIYPGSFEKKSDYQRAPLDVSSARADV